jgi:hypothetical protein
MTNPPNEPRKAGNAGRYQAALIGGLSRAGGVQSVGAVVSTVIFA